MKALDHKIQSLYSTAANLVNNSSESLCGYGRMMSALDVRQQVILRRNSGSYVRPSSSPSKLKPGAKPVPSGAVGSDKQAKKKARSRGKGRGSQGLPAHPALPPASSNPPPQAPPQLEVQFQS